jgi:hypothetical protein
MGFFLLDDTHDNNTPDYQQMANTFNNLIDTDGLNQMVNLINQMVDDDTTNHNTPASEFDWGVQTDHTS